MYALSQAETFRVVGINKDGSQMRLCSARTLRHLLAAWGKEIARHEKTGRHNILPTFLKIMVYKTGEGYTGLDIPYIPAV